MEETNIPESESTQNITELINDEKDSTKQCYICGTASKKILNNYNFSQCDHFYCVYCLFREIFKNNLKEIIDQNEIEVECKCKNGKKNFCLKDIDEIIKYKSKIDEEENENKNDIFFCSNHDTNCELFCRDCEKYICFHCKNEPEHSNHKIVLVSIYARMYKEFIRGIPLKFKYAENFKLHLDKSVDKFSKDLAEKTNRTINEINHILEELNIIKNGYLTKLKEIQDNGLEPINLIKSFYFEYYHDLLNFEDNNDIFSLRYLAQIKSEINDFEMKYAMGIFNKLEEIQNKVQNFKSVTENPFSIKINYIDIPTTFREVKRTLGHEGQIKSLAKIGDNQFISGASDNTIKFWNLDDVELRPYDVLTQRIINVGVVLLLNDNKICISSVEGNICSIKIYQKTQILCKNDKNRKIEVKYEYNLETTSEKHTKAISSIIELDNDLLVTAARDGYIIIWKPIDSNMMPIDEIEVCNNGVYSLCKLKDNKFASGDADGKIYLWRKKIENNVKNVNDDVNDVNKKDGKIYSSYQTLNDDSQKTKIRCLILLNNNYLCSGDDNGNINVYENINDEKYKFYWKKNLEGESLTYLAYTKQGFLISASYISKNLSKVFLRVWVSDNNGYKRKETIIKHYKPIRAIIELDWGNIVSAGEDGIMIIWKSGVLAD